MSNYQGNIHLRHLAREMVHLVERDEEAILYPESSGFLVSGIDEDGGKQEFSGFKTLLLLDPPRTFILR